MKLMQRFSGLILDERTGRVVAVKLMTATAYLSALVWFNYHNYKSGFNEMEWLIFLGVAAGHKSLEKLIGMKYGNVSGMNTPLPAPNYVSERYDNASDNNGNAVKDS